MTVVLPHTEALGELDAQLEALAAEGRKHQRRRDQLAAIIAGASLGSDYARIAASREELALLERALAENAQRRAELEMERRPIRERAGAEAERIRAAQALLESLPALFESPRRYQGADVFTHLDAFTELAQKVDRARSLLRQYGYEVADSVSILI